MQLCVQGVPVTLAARTASEDSVKDVGMRLSPRKVSSQSAFHAWKYKHP